MYATIFEYNVNKIDTVLVKCSCKDVGSWATGLEIILPKDFFPPREVADEIEAQAIQELRKEKQKNDKVKV